MPEAYIVASPPPPPGLRENYRLAVVTFCFAVGWTVVSMVWPLRQVRMGMLIGVLEGMVLTFSGLYVLISRRRAREPRHIIAMMAGSPEDLHRMNQRPVIEEGHPLYDIMMGSTQAGSADVEFEVDENGEVEITNWHFGDTE